MCLNTYLGALALKLLLSANMFKTVVYYYTVRNCILQSVVRLVATELTAMKLVAKNPFCFIDLTGPFTPLVALPVNI